MTYNTQSTTFQYDPNKIVYIQITSGEYADVNINDIISIRFISFFDVIVKRNGEPFEYYGLYYGDNTTFSYKTSPHTYNDWISIYRNDFGDETNSKNKYYKYITKEIERDNKLKKLLC